jgi:hypothetical protein
LRFAAVRGTGRTARLAAGADFFLAVAAAPLRGALDWLRPVALFAGVVLRALGFAAALFFVTLFFAPVVEAVLAGLDAAARLFAGRVVAPWRVVPRPAALDLLGGFVGVVLRRPFRLAMFSPFGTLTLNDKWRKLCCLSEISDPVQRSRRSRNRAGILPTEIAGRRTPLSNTGNRPFGPLLLQPFASSGPKDDTLGLKDDKRRFARHDKR